MMRAAFLLTAVAGTLLTLPSLAQNRAVPCKELLSKGGRIVKSYVMDFGPRDKVYVYLVQTKAGATQTCMSEQPLKR